MIICARQLAVLVLAAALLSGCSVLPGLNISEKSWGLSSEYEVVPGDQADSYRVMRADEAAGYRVVAITPESLQSLGSAELPKSTATELGSVTPAVVPAEYQVGPGDILYVTVWDHPELTTPAGQLSSQADLSGRLVSSEGKIFYPYVGEFVAAGKTTEELREYITRNLSRVIASPQVDVRVISFRAKRVQVTGEVNEPGLVTLDDTPKGVLEAISERGGLAPEASRRRVTLIRDGRSYSVNLAGLTSGEHPAANPVLMAGDILHVPDRNADQVFVLGEVAEQQPVYMSQQSMSLTEALTSAGGLDKLRSNDGGVLVFRRPATAGELPTVFTLDMSNPLGLLLAGEFELQTRDVVYVKATDFAKYNGVISQILPTITTIYQVDQLTK